MIGQVLSCPHHTIPIISAAIPYLQYLSIYPYHALSSLSGQICAPYLLLSPLNTIYISSLHIYIHDNVSFDFIKCLLLHIETHGLSQGCAWRAACEGDNDSDSSKRHATVISVEGMIRKPRSSFIWYPVPSSDIFIRFWAVFYDYFVCHSPHLRGRWADHLSNYNRGKIAHYGKYVIQW